MNPDIAIRPNSKTTIENITISCYGKGMIMVNHPILPAPKPVGPKEESDFWEKSDAERLEAILNHLDKKVDWAESSPDVLLHLGKDIDAARKSIEPDE